MTMLDAAAIPVRKGPAGAEAGARPRSGDPGDSGEGKADARRGFGEQWRVLLAGDGAEGGTGEAKDGAPSLQEKSQARAFPAEGLRARLQTQIAGALAPQLRLEAPQAAAALAKNLSADSDARPGQDPQAAGLAELLAALGAQAGADASPGAAGEASPDAMIVGAGQDAPPAAAAQASGLPAALAARVEPRATASPQPEAQPEQQPPAPRAAPPKAAGLGNADLNLAIRADAAPALKATVLHQATHLAPTPALLPGGSALPGANLQAIAGGIAEAGAELSQEASRSAPDAGAARPLPRAGGPVKTLTIQLNPVALGKVTVEMRLVDGAMKLDIKVENPRALEMVRADRDLILALVRKAGIAPDTVNVQSSDNSGSKQGAQPQGGQGQTGEGQTGQGRMGSGAGGDDARRSDAGAQAQRSVSDDESAAGEPRLGGDIYL